MPSIGPRPRLSKAQRRQRRRRQTRKTRAVRRQLHRLHDQLPDGPIFLAADDTVDEHRGKRVYGKGRHRDPVRSTHSYTAFRWGHKWLVVAVLVRFPFTRRPWALPVLVALYCSEKENSRRGRRHKTPPQLLRQLLRVLL